jgi:hypothetical protein
MKVGAQVSSLHPSIMDERNPVQYALPAQIPVKTFYQTPRKPARPERWLLQAGATPVPASKQIVKTLREGVEQVNDVCYRV